MNKEEIVKAAILVKGKIEELWNSGNKGKGILICVAVGLLLFVSSCIKSCNRSSDLAAVRESLERDRQRREEMRLSAEKERAESLAKEKAKRDAEEETRKKRIQAEEDASAELKRGDVAAYKIAMEKLRELPAAIMREKNLPIISLNGVTLGRPVPREYLDYTRGVSLKLKERFLAFDTMKLEMKSPVYGLNDAAICVGIEMAGSHPNWDKHDTHVLKRIELVSELTKFLPGKLGKWHDLERVTWEGIPKWCAELTSDYCHDKIEINGHEYIHFLNEVLNEEIKKMEQELRADSEKRRQSICEKYGVQIPKVTSSFLCN